MNIDDNQLEGHTFSFDSTRSDYSTCFMSDGDKVGYLADPVFPPVGTVVELTGGRRATVENVSLDISNVSGVAMIYVHLGPISYPYGNARG